MRKLKKRLFSLLLCAALAVSLCPAALAGGDGEENVSYLDENGVEQVCAMAANASGIEWNTSDSPSGWYVVSRNVLIGKRVTVTGNVHLILKDGCNLTVNGGINVGKGQSLTIYAQSTNVNTMGKLTATATGDKDAGIGGGESGAGGTITISGGNITATSTNDGAGIGGGWGNKGGEIAISGGNITATSTNGGAGIGGGNLSNGGTITISGGTVTAVSNLGAGIGGGSSGGAGGTGGTITIGGSAEITQATSSSGAGIGGGNGGPGGTITISGGTAAVNSIGGACIGGGSDGANGIVPSDLIEINDNATVTRSGGGSLKIGPTEHEADQDTWSSDGSSHWHPCKKEGCTDNHQFNKAAHTFGEWIIDTPAAATTAGSRSRTCGICQYQQTETIPATGGGSTGGESKPSGGGGSSDGGSSTPTYRPDVTRPGEGGGTPAVAPSNPRRGDTVTVTPKPDEGYEVKKVTVTGRGGKSVEVTKKPDGTYTFTQPAGTVTIDVTYVPLAALPWENPFSDVSEGDWCCEAVRFVRERGLMNGYSDGRFGPNDTLSRAQLAQILFNKEGRPGVNYLLTFSDVAGEAWYTEAIRWAASQGIVSGYGDGTFGPNNPITREQLAVMLWRYAGSPAAGGELPFTDADETGGFAREALRWAVENGVMGGKGGGILDPKGPATRAQTAQMLKNFTEYQEG